MHNFYLVLCLNSAYSLGGIVQIQTDTLIHRFQLQFIELRVLLAKNNMILPANILECEKCHSNTWRCEK